MKAGTTGDLNDLSWAINEVLSMSLKSLWKRNKFMLKNGFQLSYYEIEKIAPI